MTRIPLQPRMVTKIMFSSRIKTLPTIVWPDHTCICFKLVWQKCELEKQILSDIVTVHLVMKSKHTF